MNTTAFIFLVMMLPNTDKPVLALMHHFETVNECYAVLEKAPKEQKDKFKCIIIDLQPIKEGVKI